MMREALTDLIRRMTLKEDVTGSDPSISWQAHREAERLGDASFVAELKGFIEASASKEERKAAYFILGSIGQNATDAKCASVLIGRISGERDKHVLSVLLDALAKIPKPAELPLDPVYVLLQEKRWLVRYSAIQALKKSYALASEDHVLALLATTVDAYEKTFCHATLGDIGTHRSLPLLAQSLSSKKRDVKLSAEAAMAAIRDRDSHQVESS